MSPSQVVEREDCVLVDVVGGDNGKCLEPRHLELLSDGHEGLACHLGEDAFMKVLMSTIIMMKSVNATN